MTQSEAQTRSELIDQQLALSGWNVNDPTQAVKELDLTDLETLYGALSQQAFEDELNLSRVPLVVAQTKNK